MDAEAFLEKATDPNAWYAKSVSLFMAHWALSHQTTDMLAVFTEHWISALQEGESKEKANKEIGLCLDSHRVSTMLLGLSVETALKGRILERKPETVEFKLTSNAKRDLTEAKLGAPFLAHSGTISKNLQKKPKSSQRIRAKQTTNE